MQTPNKDRLDLWLDEALRQHASVEPRDGMEGRLLARLHSREERTRVFRRWALLIGSPALAILLIALVWRGEHTDINQRNLDATSQHSDVEQALRKTVQPSLSSTSRDTKVVRINRHPLSAQRQYDEPRLNHFPSPRPLSSEEIVLAQYAAQYPQEAALVAKEQQKFDEEIKKSEQQIETGSGLSNE